MSELAIQSAEAITGDLPDMPIEPSWIQEGTPVARGTVLVQSADKMLSSGLWSCTAGKFRWEFGWDEFVHVLEGGATITEEGGAVARTAPNDICGPAAVLFRVQIRFILSNPTNLQMELMP